MHLSREEEERLFKVYVNPETSEQEKRAIRDKIIEANVGFVYKQAHYFAKKSPTFVDDFISAGYEGLVVGFDKYQPGRGIRFLSYAGFWVNEKILKCMASFRIVAVPTGNQQLQAKIETLAHQGLTREEILAQFPPNKARLVRLLFENEFKTYYLEDMEEATNPQDDIDLFSGDKEKVMKLVEGAPEKIRETIMKKFFSDNATVSATDLGEALEYMRDQLYMDSPTSQGNST